MTSGNYTIWSRRMESYLRGQARWKFVEQELDTDDIDKRARTLSDIISGIDDDQLINLQDTNSPKKAWEMLETIHRRAATANVLYLKQDLLNKRWDGKSDLSKYITEMSTAAMKLKGIGHAMSENDLSTLILMNIRAKE